MTRLPELISLGPEEEADRLWVAASAAIERAGDRLVALCEALDLGIRAAEIRLVQRLQPIRDRFPATIVAMLESPDPDIDVMRDAVAAPKTLTFTDLLDLLSEPSLSCVGPRLHRGWEDRRFACRRSRAAAAPAFGVTLDEKARQDLLILSAYRHRLFRHPPPVRIVTAEVVPAFASLRTLMSRLGSG